MSNPNQQSYSQWVLSNFATLVYRGWCRFTESSVGREIILAVMEQVRITLSDGIDDSEGSFYNLWFHNNGQGAPQFIVAKPMAVSADMSLRR